MGPEPYERSFFEQPVDVVARELIGSNLTIRDGDSVLEARLIETEAYGGLDDPASHAFRGPTPRSAIMFGPPGFLYVYRSYGIHWCMNVVTQEAGSASAVLLRAAYVRHAALFNLRAAVETAVVRGPGNLTRAAGITGADNGTDCCEAGGRIRFTRPERGESFDVSRSTRVGLSRAQERMSRYFLNEA